MAVDTARTASNVFGAGEGSWSSITPRWSSVVSARNSAAFSGVRKRAKICVANSDTSDGMGGVEEVKRFLNRGRDKERSRQGAKE